ncbi:MAG: hypothetical protein ACR2LT_00845 [Pyrinomonadaceae bacterium]
MKIKFPLFLLFVFAFSSVAFAQTVVITPKKVTYKRPKPESEYKKSFVVTRPKVKASTPALSRKIETAISYEKNNVLNIRDEINDAQWLDEANYEVNYNKNGILDITLIAAGSGAYPSGFSKTIVVNEKTGNRVLSSDVFTNLAGLAAKARKSQLAEIKKARADYKKNPDSADFDGSEYFDDAKFTTEELKNFSVSDKGVTFLYDYEFPHVVQELQPDGRYFFSWTELKPFIRRGGLLEQFIR